jgi:DNA-directed RNA polymerase specialized sigma24 family protein
MTAEPMPAQPLLTGPLAAAGDDHRGDRLVRFGTGIRRYLRFLGAAAEVADDLAQETLLRALRPDFDSAAPGALRWLRTTARNLFWRHLAAHAREPDLAAWDALDATFSKWADDGGDRYALALDRCVQALGARERQLLAARFGRAAPRGAIAKELGLGDEGAKTLLRRVKARLRACIERRLREEDA